MKHSIDFVIGGPDMSGTTSQIQDTIEYFQSRNKIVKDMRGTEINALFHSEMFKNINQKYLNVYEFLNDIKGFLDSGNLSQLLEFNKSNFSQLNAYFFFTKKILTELDGYKQDQDLRITSMIKNDATNYVNPDSADIWIFEEPTKRGAGQTCRIVENNRSKFNSETDHISVATSHQVYRIAEFLRFRKHLREAGKIIIRSRSEESCCYQIFDEKLIKSGISESNYLNLPGHKIAFANPPTHLFIVCGPETWTAKDYIKLKEERSQGRGMIDDLEKDAPYQVLVNKRYATNWVNDVYDRGCAMHGTDTPKIERFDIYDSKEKIRKQMGKKLTEILEKTV